MPRPEPIVVPLTDPQRAWLAFVSLLGTWALSHFFVHRGIILPSVELTQTVEPWMWGALFAPELVACAIVGWRLRSWAQIPIYAAGAAVLREIFQLGLHLAGEPGHVERFASAHEVTLEGPAFALLYGAVFALAYLSSREDAALTEQQDL